MIRNAVARDAATFLGVSFVGRFFFLLASPLIISFSGVDVFGKYELYISMAYLSAAIFGLNLSDGLFRFSANNNNLSCFISILLLAIIFLFTILFIIFFLFDVSSFIFIFFAVSHFFLECMRALARARLNAKKLIVTENVYGVSYFFAILLVVNIGLTNIEPLLEVHMGVNFLACLIYYILLQCPRFSLNAVVLKETLNYSVRLIPNSVSWWIILSLQRVLVGEFHGANAMGIYSIFAKAISVGKMLFLPLSQAIIKNYLGIKISKADLKRFNTFSFVVISSLLVLSFLSFYALSSENVLLIVLSLVSLYLVGVNLIYAGFFLSESKSGHVSLTTVIGALFSAIISYSLIPEYSYTGAIVAFLVGMSVINFVRIYYFRRIFYEL